MRWSRVLAVAIAAVATPALAQDKDDLRFCPSRPSLAEGACTIDPGHVMVELSAFDWTLDKQPDSREDTILTGDVQIRLGLTSSSELQVNWTAYGHDRRRDTASGLVDSSASVGDVRIAFRQNLRHPDGKGFSVAIEPYVTLPTGGRAIGAGTWGGGVTMPVGFDLSDAVNLQFTGSLSAVPDEDRRGRHFAYSGDWGVAVQLGEKFDLVTEVQVTADQDPAGHNTQSVGAVSLAYKPTRRLQFDVLVGHGLNRDTPDLRILTGGAILF